MTVTKIAEIILEDLVKNFYETGSESAWGPNLKKTYSEIKPHLVEKALYLLQSDGFITVLDSDDEPSEITLEINAFRHMDENTLLKKGYRLAKEIREWL